jgi:hypothetical protein
VALPLKPSLSQEVTSSIQRQLMPVTDRLERLIHSGKVERRYVQRVLDFSSSPGWKDVRSRAERDRQKVLHLFDEGTLNEFLPPPDTRVRFANAITGPSGRKLVLGLMILAGQHW